MSWRAWRSRSERARYAKSVLVAQTCAQFLLKAGREAGIGAVRLQDDPREQVLEAGCWLRWRVRVIREHCQRVAISAIDTSARALPL